MAVPDASSRTEVALFVGLMIFVAGFCLQPMGETDLFFRVKVGQEILAHGRLMGRNLFSFTAPLHPDLDLAWGFEVVAALLFRMGGFPAIVVGKTLVILGAFALVFWACRRAGAGTLATTLALACAALVMRERFVERPHIVSFVGEALVLIALGEIRRRWSAARVIGFGVAMVVWANAHAGTFAGALMLFAAALGALPFDRARARRAFGLGALVVMAAFATPAGTGIVRYLALHLTLPSLHPIDEFRAATWRSDCLFFVWIAAMALAVAATTVGLTSQAQRRQELGELMPSVMPVLAMTILGLGSVRFSADAALVGAPLLAIRLTRVFESRRPGRTGAPGRLAGLGVAAALVVAAVAPRVAGARAGRSMSVDMGLDRSAVPGEAIAFVTAHGLRERMYNDFEIGSYLAFEGYPRYRVFVDPRLPAYPEEMHRLLGTFEMDRATWDAAMARYGVTSALLGYAGLNRRVAWWNPEHWALVFRAFDARVFVRRVPAYRDLIATYEIPATFSFTVENGAETQVISVKPAASPVSGCEWQRRVGDLLFDLDGGGLTRAALAYERALAQPGCLSSHDEAALAAWLGATALKGGRLERALDLMNRALALDPKDTASRANRAAAYEALGRTAEAARDWHRVSEEAAGLPLGRAARARVVRLGGE